MDSVNSVIVLVLHFIITVRYGLSMDLLQQKGTVKEYCIRETFRAECGNHSVVIMTSADFGRMQLGRCIRTDLGYIGCWRSALPVMDSLCSGKKSCEVQTNHEALTELKPCVKDLSSYLEASYSCMKVAEISPRCLEQGFTLLEDEEGALSSTQSECRWRIQLSQGHRINITMLGFPPSAGDTPDPSACFDVGTIQEGTYSQRIRKCLDDTRHKTVYISTGRPVDIMLSSMATNITGSFILHYKGITSATGCSDPEIPPKSKLERQGNLVNVMCEDSEQSWVLRCQGNQWEGDVGSCTTGNAVILGIVATVGLVVGGILLYALIARS